MARVDSIALISLPNSGSDHRRWSASFASESTPNRLVGQTLTSVTARMAADTPAGERWAWVYKDDQPANNPPKPPANDPPKPPANEPPKPPANDPPKPEKPEKPEHPLPQPPSHDSCGGVEASAPNKKRDQTIAVHGNEGKINARRGNDRFNVESGVFKTDTGLVLHGGKDLDTLALHGNADEYTLVKVGKNRVEVTNNHTQNSIITRSVEIFEFNNKTVCIDDIKPGAPKPPQPEPQPPVEPTPPPVPEEPPCDPHGDTAKALSQVPKQSLQSLNASFSAAYLAGKQGEWDNHNWPQIALHSGWTIRTDAHGNEYIHVAPNSNFNTRWVHNPTMVPGNPCELPVKISPIVIDLDGSGAIETTGESTAKHVNSGTQLGKTVAFDMDADGEAESTEWLQGNGDALLVDNRDGKAATDMDGSRLFGDDSDRYEDGYQKLAKLDENGDGQISGDELEGLSVWVDDGDAIVEDGEMQSAAEASLTSISAERNDVLNARGETLMQSTAVVNGQETLTEDVWFGKA